MSRPLVLALDTCFGPVSAAIADRSGALVSHLMADNVAGKQAETLPPLIEQLFRQAGCAYSDVSRIVVTVGPGAFTGVRVGLAFAKGLKIATRAEVLGISSLECLTFQARSQAPGRCAASVIDAKRSEVYVFACDADGAETIPPALLTVADANILLRAKLPSGASLVGSGVDLIEAGIGDRLQPNCISLDVRELAIRGAVLAPHGRPAEPVYLREPDARLPS